MFEGINLEAVRGGRCVFQRLNFKLPSGRALLLRGPNGVGKSTLLRMVAGLLPPRMGQINWNDDDVYSRDEVLTHSARLHYIGHQDPVKAVLTVAENLSHWMAMQGDSRNGRVEKALERLQIGHLHDLPARFLSAGQRRRLNLARLAAVERPLWLLDEPTVSLDADGAAVFSALVGEHLAGGGFVMAASHIDLGLTEADSPRLDSLALNDFAMPPGADSEIAGLSQ